MKDWLDVAIKLNRKGWRAQSYGLNAIIMIRGEGSQTRAVAILRSMAIVRCAY